MDTNKLTLQEFDRIILEMKQESMRPKEWKVTLPPHWARFLQLPEQKQRNFLRYKRRYERGRKGL